ncbi:MAG: hypothetical protein KA035_03625 [Candidatus Levybacteria bacterium]|nr:hypothetical protein [Candidatus Levybacteria bacterium]
MAHAETSYKAAQRVEGSRTKLEGFLESPVGKRTVRLVIRRIYENAPERLFEWEGMENIDALADPFFNDKKIILAATHRSHGDGAEVLAAVGKIDQVAPGRFKNKVYTVAGSMAKEQGPLMAALWNNGVRPYFEEKGITPDLVVSDNDVAERGMVRPPQNGELTKETMLDVDTLNIAHIEGKTKSGKTDPETGKLYGLQTMDRGFTAVLISQRRNKIPTYLLPVSIEGSEIFFDPNKRGFSPEGIKELLMMLTVSRGTTIGNMDAKLAKMLGLGYEDYKPGTVRFGELVSVDDLYTTKQEFPDNVMRELAKISSPKYLGDYGRQLLQAA